jgi:dTDP-glucose pyrophosphorylase
MEVIRNLFELLASLIVAMPTIFAFIGVYTVGRKVVEFVQTHYVSTEDELDIEDIYG